MKDTKINFATTDIRTGSLNKDVKDNIEKIWSKVTAPNASKDSKEKILLELAQVFITNISQLLNNQAVDGLADLVLDKSKYFFEKSKISNWPTAENLKAQNIHRLSLFVYNHLKLKDALENNPNISVDLLKKGFESIASFIESIFENNNFSFFSDEFTFFIFQDFFNFFIKFASVKNKDIDNMEIIDTINTTLSILDEEINFRNLAEATISASEHKKYILGTLGLLIQYKVNLFTNSDNVKANEALLQKVNLSYLKEHFPLLYNEVSFYRALSLHFAGKFTDCNDILNDSHRFLLIFRKFKSCNQVCSYLEVQQTLVKYFLLLCYAYRGIRIDQNVLFYLNISSVEYLNINTSYTILIDRIITSHFGILKELNVLPNFRAAFGKTERIKVDEMEAFLERIACGDCQNSKDQNTQLRSSLSSNFLGLSLSLK